MTSENSWTLSNNEKSPEKFQMFDIKEKVILRNCQRKNERRPGVKAELAGAENGYNVA